MTKNIRRFFLMVLMLLALLIGAFVIAVRYPAFQTFLAHRVTYALSKSLHTRVYIERVEISSLTKANFVNFYMEDLNHDTMISVGGLQVQCDFLALFKRKIDVQSIILQDGIAYIHRDSSGKKLNLTEIFGGGEKRTDTANNSHGLAWDVNLKNVELKTTRVRYLDEKGHVDLSVNVPAMSLDMNSLDLRGKKIIDIKSFYLVDAAIICKIMAHEKSAADSAGAFHFFTDGTRLKFGEIKLTNIGFKLDNGSDTVTAHGIDFSHIGLSDINFYAKDGGITGDTLLAQIQTLSAKEQSGFVLENLSAKAKFTTNELTLDKMELKTPNSRLNDYLSLRYSSLKDFKEFFSAVRLKARLNNAELAMEDLDYFIKKLDGIEADKFIISGELDGRINNLKGRGIKIRAGYNTVFEGDFYTKGLPGFYNTSLNLKVNNFVTTAQDFNRIYPPLQLPENLKTLGAINYQGTLDGFVTDFVTKGKLSTSIGSATVDANFKYDRGKNKASYDGKIAMADFDMGKYFNMEEWLGKISLDANIKGTGLTPESLNALLEGTISSVTVRGYQYKDIKVNGAVQKKAFDGLLAVHDNNLDVSFDGKADISAKQPTFNFNATVRKALLKNLNITNDDIRVSGTVNSNFAGARLDDFMGSVNIDNFEISRDSLSSKIKKFQLEAKMLSNQQKEVTLESDFVEAEMQGNFNLKYLPTALTNFARYTFLKANIDSSTHKNPQDFTLDLRIYDPGNLPSIIYPKLSKIENCHVVCDFNSVNHQLNLQGNLPELGFGNFIVRRSTVKASTANGKFDFSAILGRVYNADSVLLDSLTLISKTDGPDIKFGLGVTSKSNYADVTAFLTPFENSAMLRLEPGEVKLGPNKWHFDQGDTILIEGKKITSRNLVFRTSEQTISIEAVPKNDTATSVKVTLDHANLSEFVKTFTSGSVDIGGKMNGKVMIDDVFGARELYSDFVVNDFMLGKELIGDVNLDSRLDSSSKNILVFASINGPGNDVKARGYISIDAAHPGMKIDVDGQRINLSFLNYPFFDKYVKNNRGYITVNGTVSGTPTLPLLTGKVHFIDDTVTVSYLNTTYRLHDQYATMDEHGFDIGNLVINDIRGKQAFGSGRINHEHFRDFALDLRVTTSSVVNPDPKNYIQFLNTTEKQAPSFYGVAYGTGDVSFIGPINSPVITAYAKTGPGTYCKLPINSNYETNRYSFYKFAEKQKDIVMVNTLPKLRLNGVTFNMNLEITPDARMDIILDPVTGDVLTGYGSGNLRFEIPRNSNLSVRGSYELDRGNYLFTFRNVINKKFEINRGGTVLFDGEAYKAKLDMNAVYEVRCSVYDLISDMIGTSTNIPAAANSRVTVDLLLKLTGVLERPTIGWDIKILDADPTIKSYIDPKMAVLKNDESELYKQAFGLLVMNSFIPTTTGVASYFTANIGSTATNTVSEFISSQFSSYIGNLLEFANVRNLDVNIGYRQVDQTVSNLSAGGSVTTPPLETRQQLQVALSQRLLNNRLSINAGGNLDFGNSNTDPSIGPQGVPNKTVIPTGDFQIEYSLTPDGVWRAKAFNRTNYDYYNARNVNQTGVGISYRQEFDKLTDLKKKKKGAQNKENIPKPPPPKASNTSTQPAPNNQ